MKWLSLIAFLLTIPAANWMIGHIGTTCVPDGPCLIPLGFGLMAPSGVLMIGVALVLRDAVHSLLGVRCAVKAILAGALLSLAIAPTLALASGVAFLLSETADLAVYAPLRENRLYTALVLSGIVGAIIDSAVFLWLAFGSLAYVEGQIVGKVLMTLLAVPIVRLAARPA